ncbi:AmmeMemoRadiSam system protein B [Litoribrevibacter albus]|uniref:MEMO1 family protein GCM10007876_00420 n=1 Tax=Litoribrevibacter albus TaxID=1473156 RepID=A0AA37W663_9GAMM|nr:AmmeMemoRadiSam system protein B [Litoribrevibacter albus]GLQ29564.1 hypothetical protein GCM10007876_00420 [Litoribrevibacter albus]
MYIRQPAVAGSFYPDDSQQLSAMIAQFMDSAIESEPISRCPKMLISPHAGYIYSGAVAASAYHQLEDYTDTIKRVVILGPSHRVPLQGVAIPDASYFKTPFGNIEIDQSALLTIKHLDGVKVSPHAHAYEHSLEVQLPFLQRILVDFKIVPLVVGQTEPHIVSGVINALWGGQETLFVISTDLSHYHAYEHARELDQQTSSAIEHLHTDINCDQACGCYALNGALMAAKHHHLTLSTLDLRNSGDTAGTKNQVVGYGAYALF